MNSYRSQERRAQRTKLSSHGATQRTPFLRLDGVRRLVPVLVLARERSSSIGWLGTVGERNGECRDMQRFAGARTMPLSRHLLFGLSQTWIVCQKASWTWPRSTTRITRQRAPRPGVTPRQRSHLPRGKVEGQVIARTDQTHQIASKFFFVLDMLIVAAI